jgi:hypothetical protein
MPELKHGKNLFGEEQDLVAKVKGVLKKKRRPGHTTTCSFRVTEELRQPGTGSQEARQLPVRPGAGSH